MLRFPCPQQLMLRQMALTYLWKLLSAVSGSEDCYLGEEGGASVRCFPGGRPQDVAEPHDQVFAAAIDQQIVGGWIVLWLGFQELRHRWQLVYHSALFGFAKHRD